MNDQEAASVHVNHCVRDSELEELDRLCQQADPGDWRVVDAEVQRYGGKSFERREASLRLMARAVTAIPRLIRGIRVLEEALRSARLSASIARRELMEERERHAADIERTTQARTGPDSDIDALVEVIELGEFSPRASKVYDSDRRHTSKWLARWIRAWASGVSVQEKPLMRLDVERARQRYAEEQRFRAEWDAEHRRERDEVRTLLEELKLKKREREQIAERVRARVGE